MRRPSAARLEIGVPPLDEMKALAAASVFQVTTGSGLTPATCWQTENPSDL
jgi:hypothetical protein